jgi:hypothetical protein
MIALDFRPLPAHAPNVVSVAATTLKRAVCHITARWRVAVARSRTEITES